MDEGRVELKYQVPEDIAAHVLDVARAYLPPEALAGGPRQRITSLYLDTPGLTCLRWHHERARDRFKLRIRRYGEGSAPVVYAEVKRKTDSIVRKQRTVFDVGDIDALAALYRRKYRAAPCVLVTGIRESLREPESEIAVTADRALQCQPMRRLDLVGAPASWTDLPIPGSDRGPRPVLMELKYGGAPPGWMERLIQILAPCSVSFSKYAAAMEVCGDGRALAPLPVRFLDARRLEMV